MQILPCPLDIKKQLLRASSIFAALTPAELDALAPAVQLCAHPRGSLLIKEGDAATVFHVLVKGLVKVVHHTADGREMVLHLVRPGNSVGEAAVFQQNTHPASAVAVDNTQSLHISGPDIVRLIRGNPDFALHMLAALSVRLRMFTRKLEAHSSRAGQRLAAYLLHRSKVSGARRIRLEMSREVLANMLGIARETLSRALSRLAAAGVLDVRGREIVVLDSDTLADIAAGDEDHLGL